MSSGLILFVGAIYVFVSVDQLWKGSPGMALAWFGYALSNIGLAMNVK